MQVDSWPTTVRQLLGSRRATPALIEFLATTQVEGRPRVQEREQKERRRRRDKACGLDEERLKGNIIEARGNEGAQREDGEDTMVGDEIGG